MRLLILCGDGVVCWEQADVCLVDAFTPCLSFNAIFLFSKGLLAIWGLLSYEKFHMNIFINYQFHICGLLSFKLKPFRSYINCKLNPVCHAKQTHNFE